MYERFTDRARKVMQLANQESQRLNHEYIGTEHVLLGLVKEGTGVAACVLKKLDADLRKIRLEVEKIAPSRTDKVPLLELSQTFELKRAMLHADEVQGELNHNHVGTEHILLGLLREQEGAAAQVLMNLGLKLEEVREEVLNLLPETRVPGSDQDDPLREKSLKTDECLHEFETIGTVYANHTPPAVAIYQRCVKCDTCGKLLAYADLRNVVGGKVEKVYAVKPEPPVTLESALREALYVLNGGPVALSTVLNAIANARKALGEAE